MKLNIMFDSNIVMHRIIKIFTLIVFGFCTTAIIANSKQVYDSAAVSDINQIKPVFEDNLDSLLNLWYVQHSPISVDIVNDTSLNNTINTNIPDSVYIDRLARIPSVFKLTYNPIVRKYIEMYYQRKPELVKVMLGLADYYFPKFDDIFDYYDVPTELKYMSIIESALNPNARSRTRAIGIWQFMYGTGKLYGLTINSLVDERHDPIKETHAAAQYSKDLYQIFGDWQLVVAAYNCGPVNVNRAIRRAGGKRDYWDIYRYLPRETRGHVPAFIAAVYIMTYYKEHNLSPTPISLPMRTDTIMIHRELNLNQVSEFLKIPINLLRDLNPQYIHDIIPAVGGLSYSLALPLEYTSKFIDKEDSIFAYKDSFYFNQKELLKSPNYASYKGGRVKPSGKYSAVYYTVKTNDNIGFISDWFDCRIADILDWNDLYTSRIRAGQKLVLYVPRKSYSYYEQIDNMSFDEKQKMKGKTATVSTTQIAKPIAQTIDNSGNFIYYVVKQGDTLWDIAKLYPGVTGEDICRWNNITSSTMINPGQKIKIKVM
jgi:membrane-bound lytic murein transglycosylase D